MKMVIISAEFQNNWVYQNNSNDHSRIIYYTGVIGNGDRVIIHSWTLILDLLSLKTLGIRQEGLLDWRNLQDLQN